MEALDHELARRMARPQRHRLLHGYPMAPLLRPAPEGFVAPAPDRSRPLLVGVLPHNACNPKVRGCGFCTFPHERFEGAAVRRSVAGVEAEIARRAGELADRRIEAVYLGGGTANLTPPEALDSLIATLAAHADLARAELSLEGVPRYFLIRGEAMLDVLARAPVASRRISMGVQTFDPGWLARMGRDAFGSRDEIARAVESAHARGMTASCDLLYGLPGAPRSLAIADVQTALALGFDQICIYHLVLSEELDTEWAKDPALLAARPDRAAMLATWRELRALLLAAGLEQTTLTNFERGPRRFAYERASFDPASYDALGFGPMGISTTTAPHRRSACKWQNDASGAVAKVFDYAGQDLRLLHATRNLAALAIDRARYASFFGTDVVADFAGEWGAASSAGLVQIDDTSVSLTVDGMFHADAVTGLLAHRRVKRLPSLMHMMG